MMNVRELAREELERELNQALHQVKEWGTLLENIPDIVYQIDQNGRFVYVNNAVRSIGYEPEELIGRHFSVIIHQEDLPYVSRENVLPRYQGKITGDEFAPRLFDERRTGPRGTRDLVVRIVGRAGESDEGAEQRKEAFGEIVAAGRWDSDVGDKNKQFLGTVGTIRGISDKKMQAVSQRNAHTPPPENFRGTVGIIRDVTDRKLLERQREELLQRVRNSHKLEAVRQLAGGVAHDFNNILGAIAGYADMIHRKADGKERKLVRYAEMILSAANRAADLTSRLLAFAQRGERRSVIVDCNQVLSGVSDSLLPAAEEAGVELKRECTAAAQIVGDPELLRNAVMNLAVNAIDAMPEGGVLTFSTREEVFERGYPGLKARDLQPGTYAGIAVSDTGRGMNAEIQSRIFEPFFTTKEVGRGVGLGLASVYGTVESHKGFIEVASQQEKGSAFTMYFPACDVPSLERQGRVPEESKAESITVLVVDDEEIVAHAFEALLSAMGHKVTLCTRGDEAILLYREHASEIDLVVLGSKLRDMSGEQCFRELKKLDTQVKILIASGEHPGSVGERLLLEGVLGFVSKPVNAEVLQRTIKRAMDM